MIDDDKELCKRKEISHRISQGLLCYVHAGQGHNFDCKLHGMNGVGLWVL